MEGDEKGGFTVFYADDGLDTGPILLTKEVDIKPNETVDTLYNRFLYPEGIKGMVRSLIDHRVIITHSFGTYAKCLEKLTFLTP